MNNLSQKNISTILKVKHVLNAFLTTNLKRLNARLINTKRILQKNKNK